MDSSWSSSCRRCRTSEIRTSAIPSSLIARIASLSVLNSREVAVHGSRSHGMLSAMRVFRPPQPSAVLADVLMWVR